MSGPTLVQVAVPMRLGSISGGRFDLAPAAIRDALHRFVAHGRGEPDRLMELGIRVEMHEDIDAVASLTPGDAFSKIRAHVGLAIEDNVGRIQPDRAVLVLGGDNSITRPAVHAVAGHTDLSRTGLLTLDAHHDLRPLKGGLTNGNPIRALLEDGLPGRNVVQIGINPMANSPAHARVAGGAGITVVTADEVRRRGAAEVAAYALEDLSRRADAIHVDLDVDVLDRAFAPACPGSRPGGLTPDEVQAAARAAGAHPKVRAIDVVEVDPERDVADVTVLAAASFVLAFASGLASRTAE
ncbi:MAG TPA: arginase family protein [Actinomycetota bacterium]|nr:arginase family protein [Actinomycetota bacterium]